MFGMRSEWSASLAAVARNTSALTAGRLLDSRTLLRSSFAYQAAAAAVQPSADAHTADDVETSSGGGNT